MGNGERKVAAELGLSGIEMDKFDLLIDGKPWEVKELDSKDSVFAGKSGDRFSWQIRKQIADAVEEVQDLYQVPLETLETSSLDERGFDWAYLHVYLDGIVPGMIFSGEIGRYAIEHTSRIMRMVRKDLDAVFCLSLDNHPYIMWPDRVLEDWQKTCRPSDVFAHVAGVICVSEKNGYVQIPLNDLDRYLEYRTISKGQIKVGLRLWPTGRYYLSCARSTPNSDLASSIIPVFHLSEFKFNDPGPKGKPEGFRRGRKLTGTYSWYVLNPKTRRKRKRV